MGLGDGATEASASFSVIALGTANPNVVKASPGVLVSIHAINVNAAIRYLKLYDTKTLPVAGNGVPVRRYGIPGATTGAGFVIAPTLPMRFSAGIAFTMTTGIADNDTGALTANDVLLTLEYA